MDQNTTQILALLILILIDTVSGIAVSVHANKLSSSVGRKGLARKGLELLLLIAFSYLPRLDANSFPTQIFTLLYSGFVFFECISIVENASLLGLDISVISRFLKSPEIVKTDDIKVDDVKTEDVKKDETTNNVDK